VQRRPNGLLERLRDRTLVNARAPHESLEVVNVYAIAMNEENAAGGRIVTAPTNGAAGLIPAVLKYYRDYCLAESEVGIRDFLLTATATAIGSLCKMNASISGADVSCQGEVRVACSMAAAGDGRARRRQQPGRERRRDRHRTSPRNNLRPDRRPRADSCIERNAFGAVKAINAASLALRGDGSHRVSLDQVIKTMLRPASTCSRNTRKRRVAVSP
jgi:L-serine dehydratase